MPKISIKIHNKIFAHFLHLLGQHLVISIKSWILKLFMKLNMCENRFLRRIFFGEFRYCSWIILIASMSWKKRKNTLKKNRYKYNIGVWFKKKKETFPIL